MVVGKGYDFFNDPAFDLSGSSSPQTTDQNIQQEEYDFFNDPSFDIGQENTAIQPFAQPEPILPEPAQPEFVEPDPIELELLDDEPIVYQGSTSDALLEVEEGRPPTENELLGMYADPKMLYAAPYYGGEEDNTPDVRTGYDSVNRMYTDYIRNRLNPDIDQATKDNNRTQLINNIIANVFYDSVSALPGERTYDKYLEKVRPDSEEEPTLYDRNAYANRAFSALYQTLHEANAPNDLMIELHNRYREAYDDYEDYTPDDIVYMAEKEKGLTAKTYKQMGAMTLNTITTPLQFGIAGAAGLTRGPGEPHGSNPFYRSATGADAYQLSKGRDPSNVLPATAIAQRSYQYSSDGNKSVVKMSPSDIMYIADPARLKAWQAGLKKHIYKTHNRMKQEREYQYEVTPDPDLIRPSRVLADPASKKTITPEEVYNAIKDTAAFSYVDEINGEYSEYLEGYPPIQPPENGWAYEEAERLANEELGRRRVEAYDNRKMNFSAFGSDGEVGRDFDLQLDVHDKSIPKLRDQVSKSRIKQQMREGMFGEAAKQNPDAASNVIDALTTDPNRYNSVIAQYTRQFARSMGPEELGKMFIMSVAGATKYGLPALLPPAEVGGALSWDSIDISALKNMGITNEDVDDWWANNPGIAAMMIPGVSKPIGMVGGTLVKAVGTTARTFAPLARILNNKNMSPFQKRVAAGKLLAETYNSIDSGTIRVGSEPKVEYVKSPSPEKTATVVETSTSLKMQASEARKIADDPTMDATTRQQHAEIANKYETASTVHDEALMERQKEVEASERKSRIRDKITPTLDKAVVPKENLYLNLERDPVITKRIDSIEKQLAEDRTLKKQNIGNKSFRPPGQLALNRALREWAADIGYTREVSGPDGVKVVSDVKRLKQEIIQGREESAARKLSQDYGVTDPRVYAELLPDAPVDGKNGLASYVFEGERSNFARLKQEYNAALKDVADLRGVTVEQVKSETNRISIAEDMASNGVVKRELYALLLDNDDLVKEFVAKAKQKPESSYVRAKTRGQEKPFEGSVEVPKGLTPSGVLQQIPYGVTRSLFGKKPANIISNRLKSVKGQSAPVGAISMAEASMLASFEFLKSPFAFTNFPSWMGDAMKYLYMNSTDAAGFQKNVRKFASYFVAPSTMLGDNIHTVILEKDGRIQLTESQMRRLASELGKDELAVDAEVKMEKALKTVELDHHVGGDNGVALVPGDTLTAKLKEGIATAFFAEEGAYIDVPDSSPSGSSRIYINEIFDIEYKTADGYWINATEAVDKVAALEQQISQLKAKKKDIHQQIQSIDESLVSMEQQTVDAVTGRVVADKTTGQLQSPIDLRAKGKPVTEAALQAEISRLEGAPKDISTTRPDLAKRQLLESQYTDVLLGLEEKSKQLKSLKQSYGTANDVFRVENGQVKGVTDIRFNFKSDRKMNVPPGLSEEQRAAYVQDAEMPTPIGDAEKTVLAVLNSYVRPIQSKVMSLGANLIAGENAFKTSVEVAKVKNVVTIETGKEGKVVVKKFKGKDAAERAAEYANRINEEHISKGGSTSIASVGIDKEFVTGKRDLKKVEGYNAVELTAGYMSSYFSENAVLDYMYNMFKNMESSGVTQESIAVAKENIAKLIVASYPENIVSKYRKEGMSNVDLASKLYDLVEAKKIKPPSASGPGRFTKERLWAKNLEAKDRQSLYALYSESSMATVNGLTKRIEYYRLVNYLRESGLILSKDELAQIGGKESAGFVSMDSLSKEFPQIVSGSKGLYINRNIADGITFQQRVIDAATGGPMARLNTFLRRGAVITYLNGTMARNFGSGVLVQAQMADIPATMKYYRRARRVIDELDAGKKPSDPVMARIIQMQGGIGRGVKDIASRVSEREMSANAIAQDKYLQSILSGDKDAPAAGVSFQNMSRPDKKFFNDFRNALSPDRGSAKVYGESLNLSRLPGQEKFNAPVESGGKLKRVQDAAASAYAASKTASERRVQDYGKIDAGLKAAYSYEIHKHHNVAMTEASIAGRKVFYDHPDIPMAFAALRDLPIVGLAFAGHTVWSTKAFARYFQKNPYKAMVHGALLRAMNDSTETALQLGHLYMSGIEDTDEGFSTTMKMPIITAQRATESDKRKLIGSGIPPQESDFVVGRPELNLDILTPGIQADSTLNPVRRLAKENEDVTIDSYVAAIAQSFPQMSGSFFDRIKDNKKAVSASQEQLDALGDVAGKAAEIAGYVSAEVRGAMRIGSAIAESKFGGQDSAMMQTITNALGVAMNVQDLRKYRENFNSLGKKRISSIEELIEDIGKTSKTSAAAGDQNKTDIKLDMLLRALNDFEQSENVFTDKRDADAVRMRDLYVDVIRGIILDDPTSPVIQQKVEDLRDYYNMHIFE